MQRVNGWYQYIIWSHLSNVLAILIHAKSLVPYVLTEEGQHLYSNSKMPKHKQPPLKSLK